MLEKRIRQRAECQAVSNNDGVKVSQGFAEMAILSRNDKIAISVLHDLRLAG
jgi:hypothetical protein